MTTCSCGCCAGTAVATPAEVANPPGLPAIGYRAGAYGELLASMRARLSSPGYPALSGLTVRSLDDPAIALLDGWAVVGDLLTFYTERIANEGYLRTATEDSSLRLLARLVGYAPRPGVAAATYLAYTLDRDPSAPDTAATVPRGSRAQSVPVPGQDAQAYETGEDLAARWSWNELGVRLRRPIQLAPADLPGRVELHLAGSATNLAPGDRLLFVFGTEPDRQVLQVVPRVAVDQVEDVTVVGLPTPTLPSLAELTDAYGALVDAALQAEMYGRSRIVRRFTDQILVPARADVDGIEGPNDLADRLAALLERLDEAAELGRAYQSVRDWFAAQRQSITAIRDRAVLLQPATAPETTAETLFAVLGLDRTVPDRAATGNGDGTGGERGDERPDPLLQALGVLLPALRLPPSRPPASAREFVRRPADSYAPESDLVPQLLAALDPRVRDGLYPALRQLDTTAPLALQELQALRVVACPFGATAPLQSQFDGLGRVFGQVEWPLRGNQVLDIRVVYAGVAAGDAPTGADLTFNAGGHWRLQPPFPTPPAGIAFGPETVRVSVVETEPPPVNIAVANPPEDGVRLEFSGAMPDQTVFLSRVRDDGQVRVQVSVGGGPLVETFLRVGEESAPAQVAGLKLTLGRPDPGSDPSFVQVSFEAALAPTVRKVLALDAAYDGIAPGSWVVIDRPGKQGAFAQVITRVVEARVVSRADFGITGKVTELLLAADWLDSDDTLLSDIRETTVYARGEALQLATEPVSDDVAGSEIELAQLYDGLRPGRWIVVTGERTDIPGVTGVSAAELSMIAGVRQSVDPLRPGDAVHTTLTLAVPLAYRYRRLSVHVLANVVPATQGATRDEPIGSGDAGRAGQTFTLFAGPLTWLAADTPLGAASTLEVRVDGVRWHEADSFAGRGPTEQVYVTSTGDDGRTRVTFGDGVRGARLPTGSENVRARYRVGIGAAGNVAESRISQLATRPLGVSGVTNPVPATGGADPDDAQQARRGIPIAVTALDRLVGVSDYADFTRARAGIGRASARRLFDGTREVVHVTVAGAGDIPLTDDSEIMTSLRASLASFGDPQLPVTVAVREPVVLLLAASLRVDPDYSFELVEPMVRAALLDRLGFAARELGQPAYLSEAVTAAQAVPGVDHIDVDVFAGVPSRLAPAEIAALLQAVRSPQPVVPARSATYETLRYTVKVPGGETLTAVAASNGITVGTLLALNPGITDVGPLPTGTSVLVFRGVRPAQLVTLSAAVPDTLILQEARA